jgi:hypothetical protein|tara:strand:- start:741 stop:917 length:177 start_codon:yes stop_codon:yes gene_type:complete
VINFVALPLVVTLGVALAGSRHLDRLSPAAAFVGTIRAAPALGIANHDVAARATDLVR